LVVVGAMIAQTHLKKTTTFFSIFVVNVAKGRAKRGA
jgi:hypothetical protein